MVVVVVVIRVVVAVMLGVACDQPHFQQHSYILCYAITLTLNRLKTPLNKAVLLPPFDWLLNCCCQVERKYILYIYIYIYIIYILFYNIYIYIYIYYKIKYILYIYIYIYIIYIFAPLGNNSLRANQMVAGARPY